MNITGGKYNSRKIKTPEYENIKPTLSKTRQGIFNTLSSMIDFDGKIFLDMFAGSGIMSLEALSRGFKPVLFEKDKRTVAAIKESFKSLGATAEIYTGDSLKKIAEIKPEADVVFIDPPYNAGLYDKALETVAKFVTASENTIIAIEHPTEISVNYGSEYELIKVKDYSDKQITYLRLIKRND